MKKRNYIIWIFLALTLVVYAAQRFDDLIITNSVTVAGPSTFNGAVTNNGTTTVSNQVVRGNLSVTGVTTHSGAVTNAGNEVTLGNLTVSGTINGQPAASGFVSNNQASVNFGTITGSTVVVTGTINGQAAGSFVTNNQGTVNFGTIMATNVAIGTTSPTAAFQITITNATSSSISFLSENYGATNISNFIGQRARGTAQSPAAVQSNDVIASYSARGYGATGFSPSGRAAVSLRATETWTDTAQGSMMLLFTTPIGTTNIVSRGSLDGNGNLVVTGMVNGVNMDQAFTNQTIDGIWFFNKGGDGTHVSTLSTNASTQLLLTNATSGTAGWLTVTIANQTATINTNSTPIPIVNGGTGTNSASGVRASIGAAAAGDNFDITNMNALSVIGGSVTVSNAMTFLGTPSINTGVSNVLDITVNSGQGVVSNTCGTLMSTSNIQANSQIFQYTNKAVPTVTVTNISVDFTNIAAQSSSDLTFPITGADTNMATAIGRPTAESSSLCVLARVSSNGFITFRAQNFTAAGVDQASLRYRVFLFTNPTNNFN